MELENDCYSERSSQRGALSCLHHHVARQRRSHGALMPHRLIYCCMPGECSWPASNEMRMCSDIRIPALLAGYLQDGAITVLGYQKALCHASIKDVLGLQLSERF